jgi:hypothetical protein
MLVTQRWAVRKQVPQIANPQTCGFTKFEFVRFAHLPQMWQFADLRLADPSFICGLPSNGRTGTGFLKEEFHSRYGEKLRISNLRIGTPKKFANLRFAD